MTVMFIFQNLIQLYHSNTEMQSLYPSCRLYIWIKQNIQLPSIQTFHPKVINGAKYIQVTLAVGPAGTYTLVQGNLIVNLKI